MSDPVKSALELALEKLDSRKDFQVKKLSDEQKEAIAEVRRKYKARIAQEELGAQGRVQAAMASGSADEARKIQDRLNSDRERLNREMEKAVAKIRDSS